MKNSCLKQLELLAYLTNRGHLDRRLFSLEHMVLTVCYLSWWKFFAQGRWNWKLVQIFLINGNVDCFGRQAWFALSVFFGDANLLLVAVGILSLSKCSWSIRLQIVSIGTHELHCLFSLVMEIICSRQFEFGACPNILDQLDCYVRHTWLALSNFFPDGKFLLKAVVIGSLSKYSWSIGLWW